jgi:hypothetical protein
VFVNHSLKNNMAKQIKKDAKGRNAVSMGQSLFGEDVLKTLSLRDTYRYPPFTILDSKQGDWQARRKWWVAKGIESEIGRKEGLAYDINFEKYGLSSGYAKKEEGVEAEKSAFEKGTSVFDAALCELMYSWFAPEGGSVLDTFAGGSVRGIIAGCMGLKYTGIELRPEQVAANIEQGKKFLGTEAGFIEPTWICGDSAVVTPTLEEKFDFFFSCPPYMDLEVYSDMEADLSNMSDEEFTRLYTDIIVAGCSKLKDNRFGCFVIGDVRDPDGFYKDFVTITKNAFYAGGTKLYNDIVLLNSVGTAAMRAGRPMLNRKLAKIHQNVLVFYKGDPSKIQDTYNTPEEIEKFTKQTKKAEQIIETAEAVVDAVVSMDFSDKPSETVVIEYTPTENCKVIPAVKTIDELGLNTPNDKWEAAAINQVCNKPAEPENWNEVF